MKIEAHELRIGNWVHHISDWSIRQPQGAGSAYPLQEFDFQWSESDWFWLTECTLSLDDIQPIPLTQEWLHRFGGELNSETGVWRFSWGENGVLFVFLHQGYDKYAFQLGKGLSKPVEFVHQFQNFFFAFTETELQIIQQ